MLKTIRTENTSKQTLILLQYYFQHQGRKHRPSWILSSVGEFKSWNGGTVDHMCLLTGFTQRKNKLFPVFMTGDSFTSQSMVLKEVRLLLFPQILEDGKLSSLIITSMDSIMHREKEWSSLKIIKVVTSITIGR